MKRKNTPLSSGKKIRRQGLTEDDIRLWRAFTRDVAPYDPQDTQAEPAIDFEPALARDAVSKERVPLARDVKKAAGCLSPPQLDGRTGQKLRRGQIEIEAKLDLHGLTQHQAHERLNNFILKAHGQGKRCVLVITGKGGGRPTAQDHYDPDNRGGILRQKLPLWLSLFPVRDLVLRHVQAIPKHGGSGAWYVYLRRER